MKKIIFSFLLLLASISAFAKSDDVMIIKNDIDSNVVTISIESDAAGKFLGMRKIQRTSAKALMTDENFTLSELKKGAVVLVKKGKEIMKIKFSSNFDSVYGGAFDMDYLHNGIKGSRKQLQLDLGKNGAKWEVSVKGKAAKNLNVIAKKAAVVGTIGIEEIRY